MSIDATLKRLSWEFWVGASILILAMIGLALVPSQVLEPTFGSRSIAFTPELFPAITLSLLAMLGAIMAARAAFGRGDHDDGTIPDGAPTMRVVAPMLIMLIYVALIPYLGTYVASALAILALAYDFGTRNWLTMLVLAVSVPLFIWLSFRVGMKILLPEGSLFEGVL